jgi:hypothetical protein
MKAPSGHKAPSKPRTVDLPKAAELLKIDPMKLFKMVRSGQIPGGVQVGLAWRLNLYELERFFKRKPPRK